MAFLDLDTAGPSSQAIFAAAQEIASAYTQPKSLLSETNKQLASYFKSIAISLDKAGLSTDGLDLVQSSTSDEKRMKLYHDAAIVGFRKAYNVNRGDTLAEVISVANNSKPDEKMLTLALEAARCAAYFGSGMACESLIKANENSLINLHEDEQVALLDAQVFWYKASRKQNSTDLKAVQRVPGFLENSKAWRSFSDVKPVTISYIVSAQSVQRNIYAELLTFFNELTVELPDSKSIATPAAMAAAATANPIQYIDYVQNREAWKSTAAVNLSPELNQLAHARRRVAEALSALSHQEFKKNVDEWRALPVKIEKKRKEIDSKKHSAQRAIDDLKVDNHQKDTAAGVEIEKAKQIIIKLAEQKKLHGAGDQSNAQLQQIQNQIAVAKLVPWAPKPEEKTNYGTWKIVNSVTRKQELFPDEHREYSQLKLTGKHDTSLIAAAKKEYDAYSNAQSNITQLTALESKMLQAVPERERRFAELEAVETKKYEAVVAKFQEEKEGRDSALIDVTEKKMREISVADEDWNQFSREIKKLKIELAFNNPLVQRIQRAFLLHEQEVYLGMPTRDWLSFVSTNLEEDKAAFANKNFSREIEEVVTTKKTMLKAEKKETITKQIEAIPLIMANSPGYWELFESSHKTLAKDITEMDAAIGQNPENYIAEYEDELFQMLNNDMFLALLRTIDSVLAPAFEKTKNTLANVKKITAQLQDDDVPSLLHDYLVIVLMALGDPLALTTLTTAFETNDNALLNIISAHNKSSSSKIALNPFGEKTLVTALRKIRASTSSAPDELAEAMNMIQVYLKSALGSDIPLLNFLLNDCFVKHAEILEKEAARQKRTQPAERRNSELGRRSSFVGMTTRRSSLADFFESMPTVSPVSPVPVSPVNIASPVAVAPIAVAAFSPQPSMTPPPPPPLFANKPLEQPKPPMAPPPPPPVTSASSKSNESGSNEDYESDSGLRVDLSTVTAAVRMSPSPIDFAPKQEFVGTMSPASFPPLRPLPPPPPPAPIAALTPALQRMSLKIVDELQLDFSNPDACEVLAATMAENLEHDPDAFKEYRSEQRRSMRIRSASLHGGSVPPPPPSDVGRRNTLFQATGLSAEAPKLSFLEQIQAGKKLKSLGGPAVSEGSVTPASASSKHEPPAQGGLLGMIANAMNTRRSFLVKPENEGSDSDNNFSDRSDDEVARPSTYRPSMYQNSPKTSGSSEKLSSPTLSRSGSDSD